MNAAAPPSESFWVRFWHQPVRAERLACMRLVVALALLADQLVQFLPNLATFYGPDGVGPAKLYAAGQLKGWKWTPAFFDTDNLAVIYAAFGLWVALAVLFLLGWRTRWTNLALWFLTRCFIDRNPALRSKGDDTLQLALFLLLLTPCGLALSLDARRLRRRGLLAGPAWVPPWSLRLIQIQLCLIYCTTGLVKVKGNHWLAGDFVIDWANRSCSWLQGSWWEGTSVHYVLNLTERSRWSYAQFPVPFWVTAVMTYASAWWETLFPLLMLHRWTRRAALAFGVLFHLGIYLVIEVGFFGFYTLSFYTVWTPDRFWSRFDRSPAAGPAPVTTAPAQAPVPVAVGGAAV